MKIAFKSGRMTSGWEELIGHDCYENPEAMHDYVKKVAPCGGMKVVEDNFNFGKMTAKETGHLLSH